MAGCEAPIWGIEAASQIRYTGDMQAHTCEHCGSAVVQYFTPRRAHGFAAVLLCLACERITITPPQRRGPALLEMRSPYALRAA